MTQQEQQLLQGLIERVNSTQLQTKDDDAERLLNSSLARNPDALYILCQTVLVQQFAMEKAQTELTAARAEVERLKQNGGEKHGSFLGNLFGLDQDKPAAPPTPASTPQYAPVRSAPAPPYGYAQSPVYPPQGYGAPPMMGGGMFGGGMFGGGGGFLQGAMQTAAGVVVGEMAFRALEGVFSGGGHHRGFEDSGSVVNNYYDNDSNTDGGFGDRLASADGYDGGISSDIEDRRSEGSGFFGGDGGDNNNAAAFSDTDDSAGTWDSGDAGGSSSDDYSGNDDNSF